MSSPTFSVPAILVTSSSVAVGTLQLSIACLSDRLLALERRFAAANFGFRHVVGIWDRTFSSAWQEVDYYARHVPFQVEKAWEGATEEARVRAAQLSACAMLLEREAEDGEDTGVSAAARALLCCQNWNAADFVLVDFNHAAAFHAADVAVHVRGGVDPTMCILGEAGRTYYQDGDNSVTLWAALDSEGAEVESIEAEDVCVSVAGAFLASVAVKQAGVVQIVYRVPVGHVAPVTLSMSVCGDVFPGSPWTVTCPLGDSVILASVGHERKAAFLRELSTWLPNRIKDVRLLYRGSRNGMHAAAFHEWCDHHSFTLVFVRCDKGWVFGGYAGAAWESPSGGKSVASPNSFLFSVTGPHTTAPVRFPVKEDNAARALHCVAGRGPCFYGGLSVRAGSEGPTDSYDDLGSACFIGSGYEDVLDKGQASLTGAKHFSPVDVEVFAIPFDFSSLP